MQPTPMSEPSPEDEQAKFEAFLAGIQEIFGGEEGGFADLMSGFLEACEVTSIDYLTKDIEWQIYISLLVAFQLAFPDLTLDEVMQMEEIQYILRNLEAIKALILERSGLPDRTVVEYTEAAYRGIEENDQGVVNRIYNKVYANRMDEY